MPVDHPPAIAHLWLGALGVVGRGRVLPVDVGVEQAFTTSVFSTEREPACTSWICAGPDSPSAPGRRRLYREGVAWRIHPVRGLDQPPPYQPVWYGDSNLWVHLWDGRNCPIPHSRP